MARLFIGLSDLEQRCSTPDKRREVLEDIVIDNKRVPWDTCEQLFAFSLKGDDRDWVLGLFDSTLQKVLTGYFHKPTPAKSHNRLAREFADEILDTLAVLNVDGDSSKFDDMSTSLMISRVREKAEDDLHDQGVDVENPSSPLFEFGDEEVDVSRESDMKRREALFKALCALRFVRLGLRL